MRVIFCRWCIFLVQIQLMFALVSIVLSATASTATSEASTTPSSTSTQTTQTTTTPTTTTPMSPPVAPSNVNVSSLKPVRLFVSWTVSPSDSVYYNVSANGTYRLSTNESNCTLEDNLGGSFYVIDVRACFQPGICSNPANGDGTTYPSMPENLELINRSVNSFAIQWMQNGGFDGFVVTVNYYNYSDVAGASNFTRTDVNVNSTYVQCQINGLLTPGGNYTVQVSTRYASLQSDFQNSSFLTKPDQPRNVSLANRTVDTLCISWTQFGVVESFSWRVNDTNLTQSGTLPPPSDNRSVADCYPCNWSMNLCIHNLTTAGEIYLIEISATVSDVTSDLLNVSYPTVPPATASVNCVGQTSTTLSVQITVTTTGSYRVDGYYFAYSSLVPNYGTNMTYNKSETNATLENLTEGVLYKVEAGTMSYSVRGEPATTNCSTKPDVPKEFSSTTGTSKSINLSWTRPNGFLESYELLYTNGSSNESREISDPYMQRYNLSGLSSDSSYTINLRTLSFNQSSAYATTSSWTLSEKVLSIVSKNSDQTSVNVIWNPPLRNDNVFLYNLNISDASDCVKLVNLFCTGRVPPPNLFIGTCSSAVNDTGFRCGSGEMSYTFRDLKHSTNYSITIAAVNPGGSSELVGINVVTSTNYDWIAGVVIGCLFGILLIIAFVFLFLRWRQDKPPFRARRHSSPIDSIGGEENPTYEEEPEPVAIEAFINHVNKLSQDSNYLYACEYMLLAKLSPKNATVTAELPDNRSKNRYTDILPFDNSRVKLIPEEDVGEGDESDYINASFLPGFNSRREYIAAQGPMRSTVDSFWLMIWQQKVSIVVMVTNLSERGREKCEQYWPDDNESLCYGNVTVQLKSESPQDFYTIRILEVSSGSEKRQLFQYHFLTWPDFGIPEDIEHILTFVRDIRNSIQENAPLLVHCSAGVGRTGTFIVVDHLLQLIKKEELIDLFHIVLELRQHRPKMIQAESQYVFAHECIKIAIEKGLHRGSTLHIAEDEQANGDCLYANASEMDNDVQLYANASEIHEQPV